MRQEIIV